MNLPLDPLQHLRDIQKQYDLLYDRYREINLKWATWNNWAQNQPWYLKWAADNGFSYIKDLKFKGDYHKDVIFDEIEGAPLWHERHNLLRKIEQVRYEKSQLLKKIWFDKNHRIGELQDKTQIDVDVFTFTLEDIEAAYGGNGTAAIRYMQRQEWFRPRRDLVKGYNARKFRLIEGGKK